MTTIVESVEHRFAVLYDRTYPRVLSYCLRRTLSREDALDAAAEVYCVAWRRLDEVPDGEGCLPWLFATGRRVLANQRRGEQRRRRLSWRLSTTPSEWEPPGDPLVDEEERRALLEALQGLSESDRELLLLDAWEQLPLRQLATCFDISETAAKVRLHRARKRLAQEFERLERRARLARPRGVGGGHHG